MRSAFLVLCSLFFVLRCGIGADVDSSQAEPRTKNQEPGPNAYRTDADGPSNKKVLKPDGKPLEWFQLVEGEFPPKGSAHAITGDLILVEHPQRTFRIRVDRDDSQDRGVWD